jgi:hypothetical protein
MRRRNLGSLLAAGIALLGAATPLPAFIRASLSTTDASPIRWDLEETLQSVASVVNGEITFVVDTAGSQNLPGAEEGPAVERAFQHWEGIGTSRVAFVRGADQAIQAANNDGINAVYWAEGSRTPIGGTNTNVTGFVSLTPTFKVTAGAAKGIILDANIILNGREYDWGVLEPGVTPPDPFYDVEAVVTHEVGHFIGLDHSAVVGAAMSARYRMMEARQRTLEMDDILGASAIYPEAGFSNMGSVSGLVGRPAAVFGALVAVMDTSGRVIQESITAANGSYAAPGLPSGDYDVYVEPIDPMPASSTNLFDESDLGGVYGPTVDPNFVGSLPQLTTVTAPSATARSFSVGSVPSTSNVAKIGGRGTSIAEVAFVNAPTFVVQGDSNILIGVAGPDIDPNSVIEITGPGITQNANVDTGSVEGEPYTIRSFTVASNAPVGLRTIRVTGPSGRTHATGALRVYPNLGMSLGSPGLYFVAPGEVNNGRIAGQNPVTLDVRGNDLDMEWDDEPGAYGYHVYRGSLTSLVAGTYDHSAIGGTINGQCNLTTSATVLKGEALDPAAVYYLVTAYNNAGEGLIGRDSANAILPPPITACPTP